MRKKLKGYALLSALFLLLLITSLWNYIYSDYEQYHSFRKNNEQQSLAYIMVLILRENGLETKKEQIFYFNTGKILTHHKEEKITYKVILNNRQIFQIEIRKNGLLNLI
ncbi:MAG: hypothetical protein LBS28_02385 [Streptococcaceae bacterium]|jgi:hypothetical protein|nr:hypothetical protein [Streptococcaceae bacterium]